MNLSVNPKLHENESPEPCSLCLMSRLRFARSRVRVTLENGVTIESCLVSHGQIIQGLAVKKIIVTDYFSKKPIDATTAFWVIDRSKQCPMSTVELWAFALEHDAKTYIQKNSGTLSSWAEALDAARSARVGSTTRKMSSRFSDNKRTAVSFADGSL